MRVAVSEADEPIPEYAHDDISRLEGLACYLDSYARYRRRERLPASADLFEMIARHLRTYDRVRHRLANQPAGEREFPPEITYNPVYDCTYVGADPTRGHVYRLAALAHPDTEAEA